MIFFRYTNDQHQQQRRGWAVLTTLLLAFGLGVGLHLALAKPGKGQTTPPPLQIESIQVDANSYPTVTVTVGQVTSQVVHTALASGTFTLCDAPEPQHCYKGITATALSQATTRYLLVVMDKSVLHKDKVIWQGVIDTVASLIRSMGSQDQIMLLPFSIAEEMTPTVWLTDQAQALDALAAIEMDDSQTRLNTALDQARKHLLDKHKAEAIPLDHMQIVVIADRLDNTVNSVTSFQYLSKTLALASQEQIPLTLYCYGPNAFPSLLNPLNRLLDGSRVQIQTPANTDQLNEALAPIRQWLSEGSTRYIFTYQTRLPRAGQLVTLTLQTSEETDKATAAFTLPRDKIPLRLYVNGVPFSDTTRHDWQETLIRLSVELTTATNTTATWPFSVTALVYTITNSSGQAGDAFTAIDMPDPSNQREVSVTLAIPTHANLDQPAQPLILTVQASARDENDNNWNLPATAIVIQPPPAFTLKVAGGAEVFTVTATEPYQVTSTDKLTVTPTYHSESFLITATVPYTFHPDRLPPPRNPQFGISFWQDLRNVVTVTLDLALGLTDEIERSRTPMVIAACLEKAPQICRNHTVPLQAFSLTSMWRDFGTRWLSPLVPWLGGLLVAGLLLGWLIYMLRWRQFEIPITVKNRGGAVQPCYLQVYEAPRPSNPTSLGSQLHRWWQQQLNGSRMNDARSNASTIGPNNHINSGFRPNVTVQLFEGGKGLTVSTRTPPARLVGSTPMLATPTRLGVQHIARSFRLSQINVARVWWLPYRLKRRWQQLLLWLSNTRQAWWRSSIRQNPYTALYAENDWLQTQPLKSGKTAVVLLVVESLAWRPRRRVRLVVRSSPDGVAEICEYELEVGLGAWWWRRPLIMVRPNCL